MSEVNERKEVTKLISGLGVLGIWGGILYFTKDYIVLFFRDVVGLNLTKSDIAIIFIVGMAIMCKIIFKIIDKRQK